MDKIASHIPLLLTSISSFPRIIFLDYFLLNSLLASQQKTELFGLGVEVYFYLLLLISLVATALICYFICIKKRDQKNINKLNLRITQLQLVVSKKSESNHKSTLSDEKALKLIEKLRALEKEELFLNPNYTLNKVAKKLKTNSKYLSNTINNYLNMTFVEYNNRLRINSIILKLKRQKRFRNYTIDALAHESGYKSVTSFNYNFKKFLKVTPSQYLEELKRDQIEYEF